MSLLEKLTKKYRGSKIFRCKHLTVFMGAKSGLYRCRKTERVPKIVECENCPFFEEGDCEVCPEE